MDDMKNVIIPKSDQLNADDLLAGPKTIKITGVTIKGGSEQPISINYEGDNGKPYKACKSMCRVMVATWGADSSKYSGRLMTIYCDPKVRWAGLEVGGIRISHMSDISETMTMALTVTRGNKKPYIIQPLKTMAIKQDPPKPTESKTAQTVAAAFNGTIEPNKDNELSGDKPTEIDAKRIYQLRILMEIRSKYDAELSITAKQTIDNEVKNNDITLEKIIELIGRSKVLLAKKGINL